MKNAPALAGRGAETDEDESQIDNRSASCLQEIFDSLPLPSGRALRHLLDHHGVPFDALYQLKSGWVTFDGLGGFDFDADMTGEPVIIMPCRDRDEILDLCAWSGSHLATWFGRAFCLGDLEQIFNPATYFDHGALRVHATPLEWLQSGCDGIVIVRPERCYEYLRGVPRISCAKMETVDLIQKWNKPPTITTEILVEGVDSE
jgi:hypothetical protein